MAYRKKHLTLTFAAARARAKEIVFVMGKLDRQTFWLKIIAALVGAILLVHVVAFTALAIMVGPHIQSTLKQTSQLMDNANAIMGDPRIKSVLTSAHNISTKAASMMDFVSAGLDQASAYTSNPTTLRNIETLQLLLVKLRSGMELADEADLTALLQTLEFVRQHRLLENSAFLLDTSASMLQNNQALLQQMNLTQTMTTATFLLEAVTNLLEHLQTTGFNVKL